MVRKSKPGSNNPNPHQTMQRGNNPPIPPININIKVKQPLKNHHKPAAERLHNILKLCPEAVPVGKVGAGGRPPIYHHIVSPALASRFCLLGATDEDLASLMNQSIDCINDWKHDHPEFAQAIYEAKDIADANVTKSLYQRCIGYDHADTHISNYCGDITVTDITKHHPPEVRAIQYWLNNRQRRSGRWSNKQELDHSSKDGSMSPKESVIVLPPKQEVA